jgi:DNA-directed RNA polymerase specialized sigma24 family protein
VAVRHELSQQGFERLLAALAPDRVTAGAEYERLRYRLIKFFGWEGAADPEYLADETLTRAALKLDEGEPVRSIGAYVSAIARFVLAEASRQALREERRLSEVPRTAPETSRETERSAVCLDRCLETLPERSRALILRYYQDQGSSRIRDRQRLADEFGVSLNSLRNRALRIREKLEQCLSDCLERDESRIRTLESRGKE